YGLLVAVDAHQPAVRTRQRPLDQQRARTAHEVEVRPLVVEAQHLVDGNGYRGVETARPVARAPRPRRQRPGREPDQRLPTADMTLPVGPYAQQQFAVDLIL